MRASDETEKDSTNIVTKIIQDKNYNIIFDSNIIDNKYKNINAKIYLKNDKVEIRINPNSSKSEEYLIIHEVTHAIETNKMKKLVLDYVDKHSVYQQLLDELKLTYETNDVSSEVLANISGQLFGNQEFIKNLSLEKPKVFKRITNSLITIANKITNNYYETLFVKDLKNKWMIAYRNTTNEQAVNNISGYSKACILAINNNRLYVYNDGSRNINVSNLNTAGAKVAQYINNNIRKGKDVNILSIDGIKLTITRDTAYKIATRDNIKNNNAGYKPLNNDLYSVKLRAGLYIDEIAKISRQIGKIKTDTKNHKFAKDGFTYRIAYYMDNDGQYYSLTISVGKNGEINSIYNLGKIKEAEFPQVTQRSNSKTISEAQASSTKNISQSQDNVKLPS